MSHPDNRPRDLPRPGGSPVLSTDQTEVIGFRPPEAGQEKVPLPATLAERSFLGIPTSQPKTVATDGSEESCTPLAEGVPCVPGYEILGELGRGGMGVVYKARQLGLNRIVALKMVLPAEHAAIEERSRFRHEAKAYTLSGD